MKFYVVKMKTLIRKLMYMYHYCWRFACLLPVLGIVYYKYGLQKKLFQCLNVSNFGAKSQREFDLTQV